MWKDKAVWLIAIAVLSAVLLAGCGKSEEPEATEQPSPAAQPSGSGYGPPTTAPGYSGGGYGAQPMQPTPPQPKEATESGPTYRERYAQGQLTAEELREERALQGIEKQLGYPVGP